MFIDARNKLKPEHITQFLEDANDDLITVSYHKDGDITKVGDYISRKDVVSVMLSFENIKDTDELDFSTEGDRLLITGMDVNWWKGNARRYNKLYKAAEEVLAKEPAKTYCLGIATLIEGQLTQVKKIEGTKDAVLKTLNEDIRTRYIDSFLRAQIVINLAYEDGDEADIEPWLTLDELRDIGAIKMS